MRSNLIKSIPQTEAGFQQLARLLNYSWTAEYALSIDIADDPLYQRDAVGWIYDYAYNAANFSIRAAALTTNLETTYGGTQWEVAATFFVQGMYSRTKLKPLFLTELAAEKDLAHSFPQILFEQDVQQEQLRLIDAVNQIATSHEFHIAQTWGVETYKQLIEAAPSYLKHKGFWHRTDWIIDVLLAMEEVSSC